MVGQGFRFIGFLGLANLMTASTMEVAPRMSFSRCSKTLPVEEVT